LRIALDDFGTGGGMLMPLLTMPVDIIKIDKILIDELAPQAQDQPSLAVFYTPRRTSALSSLPKASKMRSKLHN
jgi:EAL domain-containing protein (putative c-di-GMP-specific phosphodiesterase class I)